MDGKIYNEDYFEHGIEKHLSCYSHYRWIPELTIPMAMSMVDWLHLTRDTQILDFGSSKGFLVKAFRLLYRQAWGCDISKYAIDNCDKDVEQFCLHSNGKVIPFNCRFDWCIAKDVFEHIPESELKYTLAEIGRFCDKLFAIIPLGDGNLFTIPDYNKDVTHVTAQPTLWWNEMFYSSGWKVENFRYKMEGIKDNWADYDYGNGFFILKKI